MISPLIDKFQNIYSDMPEMNSTLWTDTRFSDLGEQVGELVNKTLENYPIVYTATKDEIMKALGKSSQIRESYIFSKHV